VPPLLLVPPMEQWSRHNSTGCLRNGSCAESSAIGYGASKAACTGLLRAFMGRQAQEPNGTMHVPTGTCMLSSVLQRLS